MLLGDEYGVCDTRGICLVGVSSMQVGYCGADLKALCTEAAMRALRRRYPQIYESSHKLLIKHEDVMVLRKDFADAMRALAPAAHRSVLLSQTPHSYLSPFALKVRLADLALLSCGLIMAS